MQLNKKTFFYQKSEMNEKLIECICNSSNSLHSMKETDIPRLVDFVKCLFGAKTFRTTTLSITAPSIAAALGINDTQHYYMLYPIFGNMLSVVWLGVVMVDVMAPSVGPVK